MSRSFSAGLDLGVVDELAETGDRAALYQYYWHHMERLFLAPVRCTKPVAAIVKGHAVAGGLILASACDQFVLGDGKYLVGVTGLRVGVPFPTHAYQVMERQWSAHALKKTLCSAELMTPQFAYSIGIGDVLSKDPDATALAWLSDVINRPPEGFRLSKQLWWERVLAYQPSESLKWKTVDSLLSEQCRAAVRNAMVK